MGDNLIKLDSKSLVETLLHSYALNENTLNKFNMASTKNRLFEPMPRDLTEGEEDFLNEIISLTLAGNPLGERLNEAQQGLVNLLTPNYMLLLGPSGVGKTSVIRRVSETSGIRHIELDSVVESYLLQKHGVSTLEFVGHHLIPFAFVAAILLIKQINLLRGEFALIDLGAGVLESDLFMQVLMRSNSICISAAPEVCYARQLTRNPSFERSLGQYCKDEFSEKRERLYTSAKICIDSSHDSLDETQDKLAKLLKQYCRNSSTI